MRIDYMRSKIDKESMKKTLQKKEKENMKRDEINNVLGMYITAMTDIFYRVLDGRNKGIVKEMDELRCYSNECLEAVSKTYNCKKYVIDEKFMFK
jgi:hypothetical protein